MYTSSGGIIHIPVLVGILRMSSMTSDIGVSLSPHESRGARVAARQQYVPATDRILPFSQVDDARFGEYIAQYILPRLLQPSSENSAESNS